MKDPRSKKAIAAGLSLTLALGSVPAVAFADNAGEGNDGDAAQQDAFGFFALNANGGQFADGAYSMVVEVNEDGTVDLPTPTRSGYTFAGWYSQADMSKIPEDMQQYYKLNPDAPRAGSWFAAWVEGEEAQTYVVNYAANGGQFADGSDLASVAIDSEGLMRQPVAPTREGYTFAGWYWHADYSNYTEEQKETDKVDFSKPVAGDGDVNVFAQWTKNQEQDAINVLYVANGGQFIDGNETMQGVADSDGLLREPPAPTRKATPSTAGTGTPTCPSTLPSRRKPTRSISPSPLRRVLPYTLSGSRTPSRTRSMFCTWPTAVSLLTATTP